MHGTFFVLGWVAHKFPQLVRDIDRAGHEIGSHSYWHRLVYQLSPQAFRQDLRDSLEVLQDITGKAVTSYRAPSCSITRRSLWALDILAEEGVTVDSSIFPIRHDRYGIPGANPAIHTIETPTGSLVEFPMSAVKVSRFMMPASGGGYFRLYPYRVTRYLMNRINRQGRPVMFYMHPWEIDPQQPVVENVKLATRKRHRINLDSTELRLRRLLGDFEFGTMSDVLVAQAEAIPS